MIKLFLNFLIIFFLVQNLNSEEIYGNPKVIDGDSIHIKSYKIRFLYLKPPYFGIPLLFSPFMLTTKTIAKANSDPFTVPNYIFWTNSLWLCGSVEFLQK